MTDRLTFQLLAVISDLIKNYLVCEVHNAINVYHQQTLAKCSLEQHTKPKIFSHVKPWYSARLQIVISVQPRKRQNYSQQETWDSANNGEQSARLFPSAACSSAYPIFCHPPPATQSLTLSITNKVKHGKYTAQWYHIPVNCPTLSGTSQNYTSHPGFWLDPGISCFGSHKSTA